jgi:hypothetical protein
MKNRLNGLNLQIFFNKEIKQDTNEPLVLKIARRFFIVAGNAEAMLHCSENPTSCLHIEKIAWREKGLHRCKPYKYWCRLSDSN